jgi:hypothetical protein
MLIASAPHPRARNNPLAAELGKSVSMRQAQAYLALKRPNAVVLSKRRAK